MSQSQLKKIISSLPQSPGVYKYFDTNNSLIYIGKAKNIKKRVASYFTKKFDNSKTAALVSKISSIQFTLVETEMDAFLLENALIKKFQPKYNVDLKDDKTYSSICIKKERFPRLFYTRNRIKDGSEYFGPYASGIAMHTVLDLIKTIYPLRNCNLNLSEKYIKANKYKTCLEYDIGNCKAPCVAYQSEDDYNINMQQIKNILRGNLSEVKNHLKKLMQDSSSKLNFEQAEIYKKKLLALQNYQSKSTVVNSIDHDVDVFSITSDEKFAFVNYLKVSFGMITQTKTFELKKKLDESDAELLSIIVAETREGLNEKETEIVVPFELDWEDKKLQITVPKSGEKKKLLDISLRNALYYKKEKLEQYEKTNPDLKIERILTTLKNDLRLKELPSHIECFDNSNLQGTNPVSACVVFKNAKPNKKEYRHFIPRTVEGANDFATMEEVVFRRYKRMLDENNSLPQLVIIDGGKGQLSSAVTSLKKLNLYGKITVIGIAKRLEEIYYPEDELPLYIDKKSESLRIIQQLRDEAHRFGITHHRKRRSKNTLQTELENIKGIGSETATILLSKLKSVKKIKEAKLDELKKIVGNSKAKLVHEYFNG